MPKLYGKITVKRLAGVVKIVPGGSGVGGGKMQEKTVTPSTAAQIVTPDGGYAGLSRVNVEAAPLQDKNVAPSTAGQTIKADDGSVGLGTVTVQGAPLQTKTVKATDVQQIVTPDAGFYGLEAVGVEPPDVVKVAAVTIDETGGTYTMEYTDGKSGTGMVGFDKNGSPTWLIDDNGNTVEFSGGYPMSVTDSDGHTVNISFE